ncbi:hypothetical protein [Pasteuria penetrans]|nr:hypothetical protein [Pasteuria penetrans]
MKTVRKEFPFGFKQRAVEQAKKGKHRDQVSEQCDGNLFVRLRDG